MPVIAPHALGNRTGVRKLFGGSDVAGIENGDAWIFAEVPTVEGQEAVCFVNDADCGEPGIVRFDSLHAVRDHELTPTVENRGRLFQHLESREDVDQCRFHDVERLFEPIGR